MFRLQQGLIDNLTVAEKKRINEIVVTSGITANVQNVMVSVTDKNCIPLMLPTTEEMAGKLSFIFLHLLCYDVRKCEFDMLS